MHTPTFELRASAAVDPMNNTPRISCHTVMLLDEDISDVRVKDAYHDGAYFVRVQGMQHEECLIAELGLTKKSWKKFRASPAEDVYAEVRMRIAKAFHFPS